MRRALSVAAAVLVPLCLLAEPARADDYQRAPLEVTVNGIRKGEALVWLRHGDVWLATSRLHDFGLQRFTGRRLQFDGEELVALRSLAPDITFEVDETALLLKLTVAPQMLSRTVRTLGRRAPKGLVHQRTSSAFLNYAADWDRSAVPAIFGEAGLSVKGALLLTTVSRSQQGVITRGQTSVTIDNRSNLTRWTVGDAFSNTGILGGAGWIGGIRFAREFSLDPYAVQAPTYQIAGATATPATVEVYSNGMLVGREQLPAGDFELRNLLAPQGRGQLRWVVRDVFGREQHFSDTQYAHAGLLARGRQQFAYTLGFLQDRRSAVGPRYGPLTFAGHHRVGLTDAVTAGLRLEMQPSLASGGAVLSSRLPWGELELAASASHTEGQNAAAGSLGYRYVSRTVSGGARFTSTGATYRGIGHSALDNRPLREGAAHLRLPLWAAGTVGLEYRVADYRHRGSVDRIGVSLQRRLTSRLGLVLGAGRVHEHEQTDLEFHTALTVPLARNTAMTVRTEWQGTGTSGVAQLQKALPLGPGFGFRADLAHGEQGFGSAVLQAQTRVGQYELASERFGSGVAARLRASGALVAIGGRAHATRPIRDSFALVRVPGLAGVGVQASHQPVGRTNARGDLLVPNLLSYYGNTLGIVDQDLPLDYAVGEVSRAVAPPYRGGALVTFPVRRLQASTGRVVLERGAVRVIPAYGSIAMCATGSPACAPGGRANAGAGWSASPLGSNGEFYFENLPAGDYHAVITLGGRTCRLSVNVPDSTAPVVELGTLVCSILNAQEQ